MAILDAADQADIAMHLPGALAAPVTRARPGTAEIVLLGALGCRYGMLANPTTAARFTAFSPYHAGGMADVIILAHPDTDGHGEPAVKIGDLTVYAVPAAHTEVAGRHRAAIGLAFVTAAGGIWHTSDTTLADGLLAAVSDILAEVTLVIAHADASNLSADPARAAVCHLQTGDVLPIVTALQPREVIIQHYDAAYSAAVYRVAQAAWLQRRLGRDSQPARILPGISGLHVTLDPGGVCGWDIHMTGPSAPAISSYLHATLTSGHKTA